jgi:hypothetical protein
LLDICVYKVKWNRVSLSASMTILDHEIFLEILQTMSDRLLFRYQTAGPALKLADYDEEEAVNHAMEVKPKKVKGRNLLGPLFSRTPRH